MTDDTAKSMKTGLISAADLTKKSTVIPTAAAAIIIYTVSIQGTYPRTFPKKLTARYLENSGSTAATATKFRFFSGFDGSIYFSV